MHTTDNSKAVPKAMIYSKKMRTIFHPLLHPKPKHEATAILLEKDASDKRKTIALICFLEQTVLLFYVLFSF